MPKNILAYIVSFALLLTTILFFNRAYNEMSIHANLANRHNAVLSSFQTLSKQVNNAAVLNPDFTEAGILNKKTNPFFTDSLEIAKQLELLASLVKDSINIGLAKELDAAMHKELSWILNSNVPDSIIHHNSTEHISAFLQINALINQGTNRTNFLIGYRTNQLNKHIGYVRLWMIAFAALSVLLLLFTTTNLFVQRSKRKSKEQEMETVLNRINDGVVSLDNDWRYVFLNDAALTTHPYSKKETIGKVIWDVHPQMKGTIFWDRYHEAMDTKKVTEIESYYAPMDTWFSVKVYPSGDGLTIFYKNITDSKKAEQQLSKSLKEIEDYKFALDESSIVAVTDHKGIITHANGNFCKISKYTINELIGQDHRIINAGHHPKEFIKGLWVTIANGKIWKGELKNKAKDGSIYWVDTTIVPFLDENGKPYQYVAIRADITERKLIEQSLLSSLKEIADYKFALDESSIVSVTDQKGIIKHANVNFCNISKYTIDELISQGHRIINPSHHTMAFIKDLWVTISSGKIWKGELKGKAKDGAIYWVNKTIVPFLDDEGKPYQYVTISTDITERKKVEEQQKLSASIINSSDDAILSKNLDGTVTSWNHGAEKVFGYKADEIVGRPIGTIIPLHLQSEENEIIEKISKGEFVEHFETERITKEGKIVKVSLTISPIKDNEGNIVGASKIARDITFQKEAEEKIIKSEHIYKTIASSIPGSVICLLDDEYRYFLIEGDMLEKLGYSRKKLFGNKASEVLQPEVFASLLDSFKKVFEGKIVSREVTINGFDIISRYIPLKNEKGSVYAIMSVAIDVTQLKKAQKDIQELNRGLEEKIAQRTAQLEAVNKELESFSYSVSHDLRAPLRIIDGFSKILLEDYMDKIDEDGQQNIQVIVRNARKMGQLIDDLLNFSKLGRAEMVIATINMNLLVEEVIQQLESSGIRIPQKLTINKLVKANGDNSLIKQVWENLISNAIKYSANKQEPIMEIGMLAGSNTYYIKDNGAGFNMKYADKLFGVFQRLHKAEEFTGTGVGLALVQRIILRHGGKIWAEAKEKEGATFYFNLS